MGDRFGRLPGSLDITTEQGDMAGGESHVHKLTTLLPGSVILAKVLLLLVAAGQNRDRRAPTSKGCCGSWMS